MQLSDLLEKPLNELTDEELEKKINLLKLLRVQVVRERAKGGKKLPKSNQEKQLEDMMKQLSKDELAQLMEMYKEEHGG